jgi:hypothetical protein
MSPGKPASQALTFATAGRWCDPNCLFTGIRSSHAGKIACLRLCVGASGTRRAIQLPPTLVWQALSEIRVAPDFLSDLIVDHIQGPAVVGRDVIGRFTPDDWRRLSRRLSLEIASGNTGNSGSW